MTYRVQRFTQELLPAVSVFLLIGLGLLAAERMAFEWLFPHARWLGNPLIVVALLLPLTAIRWEFLRRRKPAGNWQAEVVWLAPLALNLRWLFSRSIDLKSAGVVLWGSVWLALLLLMQRYERGRALCGVHVAAGAAVLYLSTMAYQVGAADTFEFQVTAPQLGIAHPTGYPLFLLLGKAWTLLPFGTVAWRLNLGTLVYGVLTVWIVYQIVRELLGRPLPAAAVAAAFAVSPTFWSQAIEAEVYTLHTLIISATLLLLTRIIKSDAGFQERPWVLVALLLGVGLTNHLTTVLVAPAAVLAFLVVTRFRPWRIAPITVGRLLIAVLVPLTIYAYLPLRWRAVNGEAMGGQRFIGWVTGSRFAGALQWRAWLDDPTRYQIVGRLFLDNWLWIGIVAALLGTIVLAVKRPVWAAIVFLIWITFSFYALNYYVPDVAVFALPAQLMVALAIAGLWLSAPLSGRAGDGFAVLAICVVLVVAANRLPALDRARPNPLLPWAQAVLALPLAENGAILADSDKFPTLYYLQQAERIRPDLDIAVLPDENAYRVAVDQRIAAGQPVYLARLLPRMAYPLRAVGPLVEVLPAPRAAAELPDAAITFPHGLSLTDLSIGPAGQYAPATVGVSLQWVAQRPVEAFDHVYLRWHGDRLISTATPGRHPVADSYPFAAFVPHTTVDDFYLLPLPTVAASTPVGLEIALAPPFTAASDLEWVRAADYTIDPPAVLPDSRPLRIWNAESAVEGVRYDPQARPESDFVIDIAGTIADANSAAIEWHAQPAGAVLSMRLPQSSAGTEQGTTIYPLNEETPVAGAYQLRLSQADADLRCGWLRPPRSACPVGDVAVSGVSLPAGAINYADQIALLDVTYADEPLRPGGIFELTLEWLALQQPADNYTVFLQIVDQHDTIVGQVDAWPVQGSYPTVTWSAAERISDPHQIQLDPTLEPGAYRLYVGWYLLRDLRRLPVLNADGVPIDDKLTIPGLVVE